MRTYYLFELKDTILLNFKNNYNELYNILKTIHYLKIEDVRFCFTIYNNLINRIDKDYYNYKIKENNIDSESYICYNYTHTINDFFENEKTKMIINNSFIKIKTNKNIPSFFYDMGLFKNIFVIDFKNHDYFLLKDVISNSDTCLSI